MTSLSRISIDSICYRSGAGWHVVYTEPRAEKEVAYGLWQAGFDAYLPLERDTKIERGRRIDITRPLLPRYLFVSFETGLYNWGPILSVDGVVDILRNNGLPSRVPCAWVEAIWRSESCGIFDRTKGNPNGFEIGDEIRVTEGPFQGHHAIIQAFASKMKSATAKKRVKVLMDLMRRVVEMELDVTEIEKISPSAENMWRAA
jgi:transcriptional antiterminator RfaH